MDEKERRYLIAFAQNWRLLFGGVSPAKWVVVNNHNTPLWLDESYAKNKKTIQAHQQNVLQQK
jgi:hypothetical protein